MGMMKLLAKMGAAIDLEKVLVEVYNCSHDVDDELFARNLFVEINKAKPVKLVYMPGVAKESDQRILAQAVETLQDQYPEMFSASQNCQSPHLNMDNLRDALFASNVIKKHSLTSNNHLCRGCWKGKKKCLPSMQGKKLCLMVTDQRRH